MASASIAAAAAAAAGGGGGGGGGGDGGDNMVADDIEKTTLDSLALSIGRWLVDSDELNNINEQLMEQNSAEVYFVDVAIDSMELLDYDVNLGLFVLSSLYDATLLFRQVIFAMLTNKLTSPYQLCVKLSLISLPAVPEYKYDLCPSHRFNDVTTNVKNDSSSTRLVAVVGIVTEISSPIRKVESRRFICNSNECDASRVLLFKDEAEEQLYRCSNCMSLLKEDLTSRVMSNQQILKILWPGAFQGTYGDSEGVLRPLQVLLSHEFVGKVSLGDTISIIGSITYINDGIVHTNILKPRAHIRLPCHRVLIANNVARRATQLASPIVHKYDILWRDAVPRSILRILKLSREHSPFQFMYDLAYIAFNRICGGLQLLKMLFLLSLASLPVLEESGSTTSINNRVSILGGLSVLLLGTDDLVARRLANYASSLAPRRISFTPGAFEAELCAKVTPCRKGVLFSPKEMLHAGLLELSNEGVLLITDITTVKDVDRDALRRVLEGNYGESFKISDGTGSAEIVATSTCSTVWAIGATHDISSKRSAFVSKSTAGGTGISLNTKVLGCTSGLTELFDFVVSYDGTMNTSADEINNNTTMVSSDDLRIFLRFITCRPIKMGKIAKDIIGTYYMIARQTRSTAIPVSSLQSMYKIATAHARLSFHSEVTYNDALVAIYFREQTMMILSGHSLFHSINRRKDPNVVDMSSFRSEVNQLCKRSNQASTFEE